MSCLVILFLCYSVLLALRLPRLEKRELVLVLFVRLFDLRLFGFVFVLVSGMGCGVRLVLVWFLSFFLCISVLRVASGPRVKLVSCKSALNPPGGLLYRPF